MKIFIAHSEEQKRTAELIYYSLETEGYQVFFDRASLPVAETFDERIRQAIQTSDLFIFLATTTSLDTRRYSMTELTIAKEVSKKKAGFIIAVLLDPFAVTPDALTGCELLLPVGQVVPAVAHHVASVRVRRRTRLATRLISYLAAGTLASLGGVFGYYYWFDEARILERASTIAKATSTLIAGAKDKGYRSAEVLATWVISPSLQPGSITVPWKTIDDWLTPRAAVSATGTILLGVYQRAETFRPDRRAAVMLNVGTANLSALYQPPTTSLGVVLQPNTVEDVKDNPDVSFYHSTLMGWLLSLAPYLGSTPTPLNQWLCSQFPFYQRPPDPELPQPVTIVHVSATGCPVLDFPIPAPMNGPRLPPPPDEEPRNSLRREFALPHDHNQAKESEDVIEILYSSRGTATDEPMLLAVLWAAPQPPTNGDHVMK